MAWFCLFPFLILTLDVMTNLTQEPIWTLLYPDYLCKPSPSPWNRPPPLTNPHRNVALNMTNLPMLVPSPPLAGLTLNSPGFYAFMTSPTSWWLSILWFEWLLMGIDGACLQTSLFHLLHDSPQLLWCLFSVSWPFKKLTFEVIPSSIETACDPLLSVEHYA